MYKKQFKKIKNYRNRLLEHMTTATTDKPTNTATTDKPTNNATTDKPVETVAPFSDKIDYPEDIFGTIGKKIKASKKDLDSSDNFFDLIVNNKKDNSYNIKDEVGPVLDKISGEPIIDPETKKPKKEQKIKK